MTIRELANLISVFDELEPNMPVYLLVDHRNYGEQELARILVKTVESQYPRRIVLYSTDAPWPRP